MTGLALCYILQNVKYVLFYNNSIRVQKDQMKDISEKISFKPPEKQYRIGEIVRFSGISRQTIHNYTIMGLINEAERTEGGHRLYPETVFEDLAWIESLKQTKTLREIRTIIERERMERNNMPIPGC